MIQKIYIRNFQSHKKTQLELDPGLNVIVGSSDSGKTAIVRAINKVLRNRPLGEAFRSTWGGHTHIQLTLEGDVIAEWFTDSDGPGYRTSTGDKIQTAFKAPKTEVPEEVQQLLNMSEINLQEQFDQPFLLAKSYSPGEVAKHFNKVAKLDEIDIGLKNINSSIRGIEQRKKYDEGQVVAWELKLKNYDHLEKFEAEVEALEAQYEQSYQKYNQLNALRDLMASIGEVNTDIIYEKEIVKDEELVNNVLELEQQRSQKEQERNALHDVFDTINAVNIGLNRERTDLRVLEKKYEKDFPEICPLCNTDLSGKK